MTEKTVEKPPFKNYFKATAIGGILGIVLSLVFSISPIFLLVGGIMGIIFLWVILKVYQTALASQAGLEFRTYTVFWYVILSSILAALLGGIGSLLLFSLALGIDRYSVVFSVITTIVVYLVHALTAALLFQSSDKCIPAWRPLSGYWRPFYAGFELKLRNSKPQGPPEDTEK